MSNAAPLAHTKSSSPAAVGHIRCFLRCRCPKRTSPRASWPSTSPRAARVRQPASKLFDPEPRIRGWVVNQDDRRAAGDLGVREDTSESVELPPPEAAG